MTNFNNARREHTKFKDEEATDNNKIKTLARTVIDALRLEESTGVVLPDNLFQEQTVRSGIFHIMDKLDVDIFDLSSIEAQDLIGDETGIDLNQRFLLFKERD